MDDDGGIGIILMTVTLSLGLMINSYTSWKAGTLFSDAWATIKGFSPMVLVPLAALIVFGALSGLPKWLQIFIRDGFVWLLIVGLIYLIWFIYKNWKEIRTGSSSKDDYWDDGLM